MLLTIQEVQQQVTMTKNNDNAIIQEQQHHHIVMITSQPPPPPTTTCEICIEPMSPGSFFNYNNCNHPFCSDCISKYIRVQIEEENKVNIKCPAWKCKQKLDPMLCNSIISKQLFDEWCDRLCATTLPEIKCRCYCPYDDCKELIINECGGDERKVDCPKCKKHVCFTCQVPWHEGANCVENQSNNLFSQLARRRGWSTCPTCGYWVERISGCYIIHCRCGASFCYRCGERHGHRPCRTQSNSQECTWMDYVVGATFIFLLFGILFVMQPFLYLLIILMVYVVIKLCTRCRCCH